MPITINGGSATKLFQGWNSTKNPTANTTTYVGTLGGNISTSTVRDTSIATISPTYSLVNNTVSCNKTITGFVNNTPTICDTTTFPNVVTLTTGKADLKLNTADGDLVLKFDCSKTTTNFGSSYLGGFTNGSLADIINKLVLGAIAGRPPTAGIVNVYSSGKIPNPNVYTKNIIDLSAFSDNGPTYSNGTVLLSPRHIMCSAHSQFSDGSVHTYTDKNGNTHTRTIVRNIRGLGTSCDFALGYLDAPITAITPYSILPEESVLKTKLPVASNLSMSITSGIPGFIVHQRYPIGGGDYIRQIQAGIHQYLGGTLSMNGIPALAGPAYYHPAYYSSFATNDIRAFYRGVWNTTITGGDSGSPSLLPTGLTTATGTPLTICLGQTSSTIHGAALNALIPFINSSMNSIKDVGDTTVYAVDVVNTSTKVCYKPDGTPTTLSEWWNSLPSY
jgi:hypothetical protein